MKLLLDQNLSPCICDQLAEAGIESVHVREVGLSHASDSTIIDYTRRASMIIVSQDSDFTNLLAHQATAQPSLVLLRIPGAVTAADISTVPIANLGTVAGHLDTARPCP